MMTSPLEMALLHVHFGLLRGASLLVPAWKRSEWSQEWRTELWYVLRECSPKTSPAPRSVREATRFCLGAYQDAIWLRKRSWQNRQVFAPIVGSPAMCLVLLIGILFLTWEIAHTSTRVMAGMSRIRVYPWRVSDDERAAPCDGALDLMRGSGRVAPTIPAEKSWGTTQRFDRFSRYKIAPETVWAEAMPRTEWTVAYASPDFFAVLHLPVRFLKPATDLDGLPQIVLTHETWIRDFRAEPKLVGARLHVGSVDAIVAGIALGSSTVLPGRPKAWFLGSDPQNGTADKEFVVGHLSPAGYFDDGHWALSVGGILLGLLVTAVSHPTMGEYGRDSHKPSLARRSRFWAFLFAKIIILLGIVYFASMDLDGWFVQPFSHFSGNLQGASAVVLCILGLNWAVRDQQRRCPYCLRRMAHPVQVGQPSRTFLAWNGIELVCERGHALLHIPELPTSWFDRQRWVCLDGSWQFLFARPSGTSQ